MGAEGSPEACTRSAFSRVSSRGSAHAFSVLAWELARVGPESVILAYEVWSTRASIKRTRPWLPRMPA
jgi:hypothetical protein